MNAICRITTVTRRQDVATNVVPIHVNATTVTMATEHRVEVANTCLSNSYNFTAAEFRNYV